MNRVRIDREEIPIIRSESTERGYEVWCSSEELKKKLNRQARVEIEIETKQTKSNRLFSAYLVYPDARDGNILPLRRDRISKM